MRPHDRRLPQRLRSLGTFVLLLAGITTSLEAQLVLTGTSYTQDFSNFTFGLPSGWSVTTGATLSTLGTTATFTSTTTHWASTTGVFRNISSNDISSASTFDAQAANTNRALGFRPVGVTSGNGTAREGAVTLKLADTRGLENFSVSVSLFTGNNIGTTNQNYAFEYRIGDTGSFTNIGNYTTNTLFTSTLLTANSSVLAGLNDQSSSVYFRIRGTSLSGTGNLDTLGIDNFSLTYSAVPEPSTYAAIAGVMSLAGATWWRRRRTKPTRTTGI